jgi:hypothetical protein
MINRLKIYLKSNYFVFRFGCLTAPILVDGVTVAMFNGITSEKEGLTYNFPRVWYSREADLKKYSSNVDGYWK